MKSKSFDLKRGTSEKVKQNKTFDFTNYYKSAAETKNAVENTKGSTESLNKENKFAKGKNGTPSKPDRTPNKKKNKLQLEPLDISRIDIEDPNSGLLHAKSAPLNDSKLTSTPQVSSKGEPKVKSIMKNKSATYTEDYLDNSSYSAGGKPKKRNKSVSFMLDDTDEVAIKKTKSNDSIEKKPESPKKQTAKEIIKANKIKKSKQDVTGKENKKTNNVNNEIITGGKAKKAEKVIAKADKVETVNNTPKDSVTNKEEKNVNNKKGKFKKLKKQNSDEVMEVNESNNNEDQAENKNRKAKKKKHPTKTQHSTETSEAEGEPAAKAQKKDDKPEAIAENLESLSIGDNAHTLTNLLDEMTVVDKDKKKKNKRKIKKEKKVTPSTSSSETADLEQIEEGKEKIKWKKRKWNKDKKGEVVDDDVASTSVIVDNLPLSMVCNYKKLLADHFGKYGLIKKVGVAEVYPQEESKPVFTTTIQFYSEGAANEALAEDSREVCGAWVRVRRARPAAQTTLVVRSYGDLTDQTVCNAFAAAGRIRAIRHLVKGRKAIATAFVEFEGPESVSRALALTAEARAGGKRLHAARYLPRHRPPAAAAAAPPSEHDQ